MNISNETPMVAGVGSNDSANASNNGLTTGLLAGMALARRDREPVCSQLEELTCNNTSDIRFELQEVKSDLRETLFEFQAIEASEFRNLHNRLCESEKEALKATFENRVKLMEVECSLQKDVLLNRIESDKQFTALSKQVDDCCCDIKQGLLQSKLEATQDELNELRIESSAAASTNTIINALVAAGIILPAGVLPKK